MWKEKYKAFISYSHADEQWAKWLHKNLEAYRLPKRLVEEQDFSGNRLAPIFRDREGLASSNDLSQTEETTRNGQLICIVS